MEEHERFQEDRSSEAPQDLKGNATDSTHQNTTSDQKTCPLSGEMHEIIEINLKRPLCGSVDLCLAEEFETQCLSKQIKLDISENVGDCVAGYQECSSVQNSVSSPDTSKGTSRETLQELASDISPKGDHQPPQFPCTHCDFVTINDFLLKKHISKTHAEKVKSFPRPTSVDVEEFRVNCAVESAKEDPQCRHCIGTVVPGLDRPTENSSSNIPRENNCPLYSCNGDDCSALKTLIPKVGHPEPVLCCKLCGVQYFDENLLHAHLFGKTHLRRQHLSARLGLAQISDRKPLSNKQPAAMKQMTDRKKSDESSERVGGSKELPDGDTSLNDATVSFADESVELVVEMSSSNKISAEEKPEMSNGGLDFTKCTHHEQSAQGRLSGIADKLQSTTFFRRVRAVVGKARFSRRFGLSSLERSSLALNSTFRKSGKSKFSLLSVSKRNVKHRFGAHVKGRRLTDSSVKELKLRCTNQIVETPEAHALNMSERSSSLSSTLNHVAPKRLPNVSDFKILRTCPYCDHVFQNRKGMEVHVKRCHTKEMLFHCQPCGYSCVTRGDFEKHCQSKRHKMGIFNCVCRLCSFASSDEVHLRDHMSNAHNMSFCCTTCKFYFQAQEDMVHHKETELHLNLVAHQNTPEPSTEHFSSPARSSNNLELGSQSTGQGFHEIEVTMQEVSGKPLEVRNSHEMQHSTLGAPQFQCKKCFYKTRSSTVLTRHIKLRHHTEDYHFLCKACNLYSMCKDGMEKHIKRSKHIENAKKNNIGLLFEECIEKVCIGASNSKQTEPNVSLHDITDFGREGIIVCQSSPTRTPVNELVQSRELHYDISHTELVTQNAPKRGRPKGKVSRICNHCGLLASSVTNLTVHIRRKHSRQYSYLCKVCNYYTVTKGDMERHCTTRKHKGRLEMEDSGKQSPKHVSDDGPTDDSYSEKSNIQIRGLDVADACKADESDAFHLEEHFQQDEGSVAVEVESVILLNDVSTEIQTDEKQSLSTRQGSVHQENDMDPHRAIGTGIGSKCTLCNFVAHSFASLELHVKRKHTKEFEYYCMACDYYAVTRREMIRHATTEKHKLKRQSYLDCSNATETNGTDVAQKAAETSEAQCPKIIEEFPLVLGNMSCGHNTEGLQNINSNTSFTVMESCESSKMSETGNATSSIQSSATPGNGTYVGIKLGSLKGSIGSTKDILLPQEEISGDNENVDRSNFIQVMPEEDQHNIENSDAENRQILMDHRDTPESGHDNSQIHFENQSAESNSAHFECSMSHSPNINVTSNHGGSAADNKCFKRDAPEQKDLTEEHQVADHAVTDNVWDMGDSVTEHMQQKETIICGDDNQANTLYSVDMFDSSIVRLRSPCEGGPQSQLDDGSVINEIQLNEYHLKTYLPLIEKRKKFDIVFHGETARVRCDDCGFLADGLSGLNVHISMKHPSKEKHFHCLLCGKSFYTESNLHQHLSSAGHIRNEQASVEELPEGGATFKCVKCTEPFDNEQNLFLHIKEQHEELLREVNKYIVEDTEQINREREENQGNVCKYCGKMCKSSNSMAFLAHIRTHTGSKPFKCKICHFATAQLGDARNHVKRHLGMREYKCHVCGVAFVMKKHLNTHLLGKHGVGTPKERKFTCSLCDRCFTEKWALNNHMKLHTGEKPYKCTWPSCHYSFLTASAMKDHYRTHTGEKSFLCDLCGFAGGTRHALTKHRRQHTGEKPFKCEECNFASTTQSHLTRHKRVHTGEKPYRCPWCDYRSNCAENIRKHILHTGKHEGVKMYNCPKCDYGTNVPVEFRNHLKELHLDIENPDLAYLHAGIVSKSYECRLKGQGATFVETISTFATTEESCPIKEETITSGLEESQSPEQVQQVIIFQGFSEEYSGDFAIDASVEETAAATLQTLAMAGQVASVVHITEDGQVITTSQNASHVGAMIPGRIISEHLQDGSTQVVVVEGPVGEADVNDSIAFETVTNSSSTVVQQVMTQGVLEQSDTALQTSDSPSALDALLCAVTELGEVGDNKGHQLIAESNQKDGLADQNAPGISNEIETHEVQVFHDVQERPIIVESGTEVTQVTHPATIFTSQESAQAAFGKMVQGVLEFAVCDSVAADQLMKEGVTQVILNNEGTVHMLSREGSRIMMRDTSGRALQLGSQHMNLVESDGEISQIIVTEEIAQAMVQGSNGSFPEGTTHYFVTELPQGGVQDEASLYSHTVIETVESQEIIQAGTVVDGHNLSEVGIDQQVTNVVVYTEVNSQTANVASQQEQEELQACDSQQD
ncbi:zinc finger protein 407 [Pleurodeles waltl]